MESYFGNHWNINVQRKKDSGGVGEPNLPDFSKKKKKKKQSDTLRCLMRTVFAHSDFWVKTSH